MYTDTHFTVLAYINSMIVEDSSLEHSTALLGNFLASEEL